MRTIKSVRTFVSCPDSGCIIQYSTFKGAEDELKAQGFNPKESDYQKMPLYGYLVFDRTRFRAFVLRMGDSNWQIFNYKIS